MLSELSRLALCMVPMFILSYFLKFQKDKQHELDSHREGVVNVCGFFFLSYVSDTIVRKRKQDMLVLQLDPLVLLQRTD